MYHLIFLTVSSLRCPINVLYYSGSELTLVLYILPAIKLQTEMNLNHVCELPDFGVDCLFKSRFFQCRLSLFQCESSQQQCEVCIGTIFASPATEWQIIKSSFFKFLMHVSACKQQQQQDIARCMCSAWFNDM